MAKYTKKAIKDAFIRLLDQKPFDRITVKDIALECGINRNSFYYHYEDISALIKDILKDIADAVFIEGKRITSMQEAENVAISFVTKNKRAAYHMYNSSGREIYEKQLLSVCGTAVERYFNDQCAGRNITERDMGILIRVYKDYLYGTILDWMESGMDYDLIKDFERYSKLTDGNLASMLDKAESLADTP